MILNNNNFLEQFYLLLSLNSIDELRAKKFIVALSGGLDSIVLLHLLFENKLNCAICHINYQLRGDESIRDMQFCMDLSTKYNYPIFIHTCNTYAYSSKHKMSIQAAARKIRYDFFEEIRIAENADYILTAHHLDDNIETVIFNLTMGCGFRGLHGILAQQNHILRPLLWSDRMQIKHYARSNNLIHVEDSSNQSDKYKRNFIRHHIAPYLQTLNPNLSQTFFENIQRFTQAEYLLLEKLDELKAQYYSENNNIIKIDLNKINIHPSANLLLYEWINNLGFNSAQIQNILEASRKEVHNNPQWYSVKYIAQLQQKSLFISSITTQKIQDSILIFERLEDLLQNSHNIGLSIEISTPKDNLQMNNAAAYWDADNIHFPLKIRTVNNGDIFRPIGMKGQSKKIKDFIKDLKLSPHEKSNIRVWEDGKGDILWVMSYRQSEKAKYTEKTKRLISLIPFQKTQ